MQYKTMTLELLMGRTELYEQLRLTHRLLPMLETLARELRASHATWKEILAQEKPESHPSQIASEALELALKELQDGLPPASPPDEETPDAAIAFVRSHTPSE